MRFPATAALFAASANTGVSSEATTCRGRGGQGGPGGGGGSGSRLQEICYTFCRAATTIGGLVSAKVIFVAASGWFVAAFTLLLFFAAAFVSVCVCVRACVRACVRVCWCFVLGCCFFFFSSFFAVVAFVVFVFCRVCVVAVALFLLLFVCLFVVVAVFWGGSHKSHVVAATK